jgi:antitoxin FitA
MASITIRNLKDDAKRRLRIRAAENGRSMEEEAREILEKTVTAGLGLAEGGKPFRTGAELYDEIRALFEPLGGLDIELPPRHPMRDPPDFSMPKRRSKGRRK